MSLKFFAESHTYELDGMAVDGVTAILKYAGLVDDRWFTPESRERGVLVHAACQLDDEKDLDEESLDPVLARYLKNWRAFKKENRVRILRSELQVFSRELWYAGTLDRYAIINGRRYVLDLKSGGLGAVKPQLGAYALAMREQRFLVHGLASIQLTEESHKFKTYNRAECESEWMTALEQARETA